MQTKSSSGIVLLQNVPHKNSRTYCDENYNTSSFLQKKWFLLKGQSKSNTFENGLVYFSDIKKEQFEED